MVVERRRVERKRANRPVADDNCSAVFCVTKKQAMIVEDAQNDGRDIGVHEHAVDGRWPSARAGVYTHHKSTRRQRGRIEEASAVGMPAAGLCARVVTRSQPCQIALQIT